MKTSERSLYLILCLALLSYILFLQNGSHPKKVPCPELEVKQKKVDTTFQTSKDSVIRTNPKPSKVIPPPPAMARVPARPNTATDKDTVVTDESLTTPAIVNDYYSSYIYDDSLSLQYGKVRIIDTVSQNRIMGRSIKSEFNIPVIRETVTVGEPKRNQVFLGLGVMGTQVKPVSLLGPEIVLKTKSDRMYSVGVYMGESRVATYKAGLYFKL